MKRTLPALLVLALLGACQKQEPRPEATGEKTSGKPAGEAPAMPEPDENEPEEKAPENTAGATDADAAAARAKGIAWLRAQAKDGVWMAPGRDGSAPSAAFTALAITPIAAALPREKRASDPLVKKAAAFILSCLAEDGAVRQGPASQYDNYFTSTALMALETIGDPAHAAQCKKMRDFILTLQRKEDEGRLQGGIGYDSQGDADLSNSQFAIEALRAAGVPEDDPAMQQALKYLERVQNRSENEENKGAAYELEDPDHGKVKVVHGDDGSGVYKPGVSKAGLQKLPDGTFVPRGYGSMTYALLKCYILVGLEPDDARVQGALDWLGENYTWDKNPGFEPVAKLRKDAPYWGLYYYYMTAAKALSLVGKDTVETPDGPRDWRADLRAALVKRQKADGSWVNDQSERWEESDPVITTSYALVALQEIAGIQ
jgi:squalene-hopene/tetraprenyl-beta-curcumene cyclase